MPSDQSQPRAWVHLLLWWPALFGLWLLLAGSIDGPELLVAAVCSFACAGLAAGLRKAGVIPFDPGPRWLLRLPRLWLGVVRESGLLFVHLIHTLGKRRREGSFLSLERKWRPGDPAAMRERAWITLAMSMTPNTLVVGIDAARGLILLHQLVPGEDAQKSLEELL